MKKAILAILVLQAFVLTLCAQPRVITNDAVVSTWLLGTNKYLLLTESLAATGGGGLFAIQIDRVTLGEFFFQYAGIAEPYALYEVAPGTVIDPAFASSTAPVISNSGGPFTSSQFFTTNTSKLYAYWDDRPLPGGNWVPDAFDNFGWVRLSRTGTGLVATASATALGGGIIAGTFTSVPEPSSAILMSIGTAFLWAVGRIGFFSRQR